MKRLLLTAAFALAAAACGGNPAEDGPTCAQVMDHALALTAGMQGGRSAQRMGQNRTLMIKSCEQHHMGKEQRTCMFAATDATALAACSNHTPPPAPSGSGKPAP